MQLNLGQFLKNPLYVSSSGAKKNLKVRASTVSAAKREPSSKSNISVTGWPNGFIFSPSTDPLELHNSTKNQRDRTKTFCLGRVYKKMDFAVLLLSRARHPWLDWIGWVGLGKGQNSLQSGLRHVQLAPDLCQRHTGPPQLNGCKLLLLLERLLAHPHLTRYSRKTAKSIFLYTLPRQKVFVRSRWFLEEWCNSNVSVLGEKMKPFGQPVTAALTVMNRQI